MSISKFIFTRVMGWKIESLLPADHKCIFLFAPHTSFVDFIVGFLYCRAQGRNIRFMVKEELFRFPLGPILRALKAFPINRSNPQKTIMSLVHEAAKAQEFTIAICPEGTRKAVHKWKTGYHTIARQTGLPVYLAYADFDKKVIGCLQEPVILTENARTDTDAIQKTFRDLNLKARHPEGYATE